MAAALGQTLAAAKKEMGEKRHPVPWQRGGGSCLWSWRGDAPTSIGLPCATNSHSGSQAKWSGAGSRSGGMGGGRQRP